MTRRPALVVILLCTLILLCLPAVGKGRPRTTNHSPTVTSEAASTPTETKPAGSARVRLWKACDTKEAANNLQIHLASTAERNKTGTPLALDKGLYQFTDYQEFATGPSAFELELPGKPPTRLDINLTKDHDYTLLVRAQHGTATAELISDTRDDERAPTFKAYSLLFGGKGDLQISLGDALTVHLNTVGGSVRARGIKADFYQIVINGTDGRGQTFRWNAETDLRKAYRSTLLIGLDSYGRIRPQLIEDSASNEAAPLGKSPTG